MIKRTAFILSFILGLACASQGQVMMLFTADSLSYITSPLAIDSLFYWFDASQGVTDSLGGAIATDEGVGTWNDLSGRNYHASQTTNTDRPVYKATGGSGSKPCLQWDGSDDYLKTVRHWYGSDDFTFFAVVKYRSSTRSAYETIIGRYEDIPASDTIQFVFGGAGDRTGTSEDYATQLTTSSNGSSTPSSWGNFDKPSAWTLMTITYDGADNELYWADGSSQTWATDAAHGAIFNGSNFTGIGGVRVNSGPVASVIDGWISEIIMYTKVLTAAERGAIETYLNKKYDLY